MHGFERLTVGARLAAVMVVTAIGFTVVCAAGWIRLPAADRSALAEFDTVRLRVLAASRDGSTARTGPIHTTLGAQVAD
jgi:hypothetical protein